MINEGEFLQHVFDNVDVNVRTLDGLNTFNAMSGIQCISPGSIVEINIKVERIQSGTFNSNITTTPILNYTKKKKASLNLIVEDLQELLNLNNMTIMCEYNTFSLYLM